MVQSETDRAKVAAAESSKQKTEEELKLAKVKQTNIIYKIIYDNKCENDKIYLDLGKGD